jgi:hypothetical protein
MPSEPAGNPEQPATQRPGGADRGVRQAELLCPSQQVVRERGDHGPRTVGVELAGGEVHKRLVLELGDHLLNDGVVTMLGLDHRESVSAVGDQAEVPPVGPQFGLLAEQPGTAHDQAPSLVDGLGDLRLPVLWVVLRL